jgi:hypothetical protein
VATRRTAAQIPEAGSGAGQLQSRADAREEGQGFAGGGFWLAGSAAEVRLDLVAVAAAVFPVDHVAGYGQAGDDAAGAAPAGRGVAQLRAQGRAMHSGVREWLARKLQLVTLKKRS